MSKYLFIGGPYDGQRIAVDIACSAKTVMTKAPHIVAYRYERVRFLTIDDIFVGEDVKSLVEKLINEYKTSNRAGEYKQPHGRE